MEIVAISRSDGLAILDNGDVVPFANVFDAFGNETDNREDGVSAVAALPNGTWVVIDFSDYDPVSIH